MTLHLPSAALAPHTTGGYTQVSVIGGEQRFLRDGVLHREDGPALVSREGDEHWYRHGLRHRVGGPAVTSRNGATRYFEHGAELPRPDAA